MFFEEKVFTQVLELFKAICFTANETGMNEPYLVHLLPYFTEPISEIKTIKIKEEVEKQESKKTIINMKSIIERKEENEKD